jgi:hypothetical protein
MAITAKHSWPETHPQAPGNTPMTPPPETIASYQATPRLGQEG